MASQKKKNKLKNSYCSHGMLKNKSVKLKRIAFYTSSLRKELDEEHKERKGKRYD